MLEINELDVIGVRVLDYIPKHFARIKISDRDYFETDISNWISNRLKGRYVISTMPSIDSQGRLKVATYVAFEDQKELTYFMLACPHFRRL
jgi:hypothetical protein